MKMQAFTLLVLSMVSASVFAGGLSNLTCTVDGAPVGFDRINNDETQAVVPQNNDTYLLSTLEDSDAGGMLYVILSKCSRRLESCERLDEDSITYRNFGIGQKVMIQKEVGGRSFRCVYGVEEPSR